MYQHTRSFAIGGGDAIHDIDGQSGPTSEK